MAVNLGQRNVADTPGNRALYACDEARHLAIHTIKICNNQNIFLPEYQSALIMGCRLISERALALRE